MLCSKAVDQLTVYSGRNTSAPHKGSLQARSSSNDETGTSGLGKISDEKANGCAATNDEYSVALLDAVRERKCRKASHGDTRHLFVGVVVRRWLDELGRSRDELLKATSLILLRLGRTEEAVDSSALGGPLGVRTRANGSDDAAKVRCCRAR